MAKWLRAVGVDEFRNTHKFVHRRKEIAIFRLPDGIYATDNACSHEYSQLSEGMILGEDVYCPKHGSRFEIKSGKVKDFPATKPIKTFEVKIEDGAVWVKV